MNLIQQYIKNAIIHIECAEKGNYEDGNKAHDALIKSYQSLKKEDPLLKALEPLLKHESTGVRLWAATHLLPIKAKEAVDVLKRIGEGSNFAALDAEMVLKEWSKGTLKLDP